MENIKRASAADAELTTLHIYVEWLKIPDLLDPGVTDRSNYERHHRGVNGWMMTCHCHDPAETLPYIGLFTMVGIAVKNKTKPHIVFSATLKLDTMNPILDQCYWTYIEFSEVNYYPIANKISGQREAPISTSRFSAYYKL